MGRSYPAGAMTLWLVVVRYPNVGIGSQDVCVMWDDAVDQFAEAEEAGNIADVRRIDPDGRWEDVTEQAEQTLRDRLETRGWAA